MDKNKILEFIEKEPIGDRWCLTIKNCMKEENKFKHVSIVYDDNEDGARERLYNEFIEKYGKGLIKDGFI
mgnify:CR=1 FL=1